MMAVGGGFDDGGGAVWSGFAVWRTTQDGTSDVTEWTAGGTRRGWNTNREVVVGNKVDGSRKRRAV